MIYVIENKKYFRNIEPAPLKSAGRESRLSLKQRTWKISMLQCCCPQPEQGLFVRGTIVVDQLAENF